MLQKSPQKNNQEKIELNLINVLEKYNIKCYSEFFDKCNFNEFCLIKELKDYKMSIDFHINLRNKYYLDIQRKDRWYFLLNYKINSPNFDACAELNKMFKVNNINKDEFRESLKMILNCIHPKINTLWLYGSPNSGKTMLARFICDDFLCAYLTTQGQDSDFYYANMLNKSLVLGEELLCLPRNAEDFKSIFGGCEIDVNKKYAENKERLSRTPMIITSNHKLAGRGYLQHVDECAINRRCAYFCFSQPFTPSVKITKSDFVYFLNN